MAKKTDVKKKETTEPQKWLDRITTAKKVKKDWRDKFQVDLAYQYRDGIQRPSHVPSSEWITVNKIYSNLKAELPTLYSNDPYFYIKLSKSFTPHPMDIAKMEVMGKIRQSMLNYLKGELDLKSKIRVNILDAYFQYGVLKTHYQADVIENPSAGQALMGDDNEPMFDETSGQAIMEPENLPANEAYKITRIHPDDFLVDGDAGPLWDSVTWCAHRIKRPLEDVQEDKKYDAKARKSVKPTEALADDVQRERERRKKGSLSNNEGVDPDMVILYEIYDLKKKKMLVIAEGCEEFLMAPQEVPKGIEGQPFEVLRLGLLRDDGFYPIPPVSQWLDPQREYNELRSKILTHRKRFNRKYTMYQEAFANAEDAAGKLESGGDGTVILTTMPGQAIWPVQDASLDQNHIQEILMLRNDFEELATGSNQMGAGAGVDSATEAGIIEKRVSLREGDSLSAVMDFTSKVGRKIDQLVQANITKDQAIKVNGPEGEYWELVKVDHYKDIEGEYQYSMNVGSVTPQLPEIERAQWMAFLGLIANAPQLATSRTLLKRMAEMHHIEDENMIDELWNMAKQMMQQGQVQGANGGSAPGAPDFTTMMASRMGGSAAGINNVRGGAR